MSNKARKTFVTYADCLTTDLPADIRPLSNNNGIPSSESAAVTLNRRKNGNTRKAKTIVPGPPPPCSPLSSSAEIPPPPRKPKKYNKKSNNNNRGINSALIPPLSSIICNSFYATTSSSSSSGLSSGASSMGTLNYSSDATSLDTVLKSSSSSAASSAGFCDMTSNEDEDFATMTFFDPPKPKPAKQSQQRPRKPQFPNLQIQQYYYEQHQFYLKIYCQQIAALAEPTVSPKINGIIHHQHLGLPPQAPPQEPFFYDLIKPGPCEEAFFARLKSHDFPNYRRQKIVLSDDILSPMEPVCQPTEDSEVKLEFHKQIQQRLMLSVNGGGDKISETTSTPIKKLFNQSDPPPTTPIKKQLSDLSSQKGESGYQSEFSAQCSTADGETDSRCSDPVLTYSSVVARGSKQCADDVNLKDDLLSFNAEDQSPVPDQISELDLLSEFTCDYFEQVAQTERTLLKKLRLRDMLYYSLAPLFPVCGLYVVGSSLNGFGNENSDMDLCLVITSGELDQRTDAMNVLYMIRDRLESLPTIREQTLIAAKVPILRIKFSGPYADVIVDLNVNNTVAVKNTHLLCYYAFFDWRVRPLVAVIKEWAKQNNINDASQSTFTSYSLVLMVLHYLQVLDDPVLPSLQNLFPKRFNSKIDIRSLNLSYPLDDASSSTTFKRENTSTLGELLIGFFKYYAFQYNYDKDVISVRLGREVERSEIMKDKNHQVTWSPLFIEEPFSRFNTAHSIYDLRVFQSIKQKFRDAYEILESSSDLNKLLNVRPIESDASF